MAIKRESDPHLENRAVTEETLPLHHQSRASSVATMVDGPIPLRAPSIRASSVRATSVIGQSHPTVPLIPVETSNASHTPADSDVEMANGNAHAPTTSDAMEKIGQRSHNLIQVIQKLSAFNIDTTLPTLPKIILIGDQSAGKSSVIEGLCDITLPRNGGTCTRCPFLLTTTSTTVSSEAWTCRISILSKYAYLRCVEAGQDGEEFDNWQKQKETSSTQFSVIYRKEDLDQALRRAQQAILNPSRDPSEFRNTEIDPKREGKTQVGFSPNVVCLEIASAGLPELSFYDLPGAINSMSDENEQHLVPFVETLLKSYIRDEGATVLLACAANQDTETSTAIRFLTDCIDANGRKARERAVGVLTKPDLVDDNEEKIEGIKKIMGGGGFRMGHGWFVTKQPSQKQIDQGITHEEARTSENAFFTAGPWAQDLAVYQSRFGTPQLQDALSKILTSHIVQELPGIVSRVQHRLDEVDQTLATFPAQDAAPTIAVVQEVDALKTALLAAINADSLSAFRTEHRGVFRVLKQDLVECRPIVALSTPGYVKQSALVLLDDSDDESPSKKIRPGTARACSAMPARSPAPTTPSERRRKPAAGKSAVVSPAARAEFNLEQVKLSFDSAPGADLPGGISNITIKNLILDTLCGWQSVTDKTMKAVKLTFLRMLDRSVSNALAARQATQLFEQASRIVRSLFDELMAEQRATIDRIISRERYRPITHASETLGQKKQQHKSELQARRLKHRVQEHFETLEAQGYKVNQADVEKKSKEGYAWALETLGPDQYEREVEQLATPLAYYDIASMQLCDNVARELEYGLLHAYEERVHRHLLEELRTGDAAHCAWLLAADPNRQREREGLIAEKEKLTQALAELNSLPVTHA